MKRAHLTRYKMYKEIKECLINNNKFPIKGNVLGISGIEYFLDYIDKSANVVNVNYPEIDMQNLPFADNTYDYVISDQVIEHVTDPKKGLMECHRILKKGGIGIHTSCFINSYHPIPIDYWRFSKGALTNLCDNYSKILLCNGWGNRIVILLIFISDRLRFIKVGENKYSLLRMLASYNENEYPIVTYIVGEK